MKLSFPLLCTVLLLGACKGTWAPEDKEAFYQACTEEDVKAGDTKEEAKTYCDCVFDKMSKKYPNENDALEHMAQLAKDTDLIRCKLDMKR